MVAVGCNANRRPPPPNYDTTTQTAPATTTTTTTTTTTNPTPQPTTVEIVYRLERRTPDADFEQVVEATLHDPRGWEQAGFRFRRDDSAGPYRIVLGEAAEVHELCKPYDVYRTYSCQNGPVVALNAERWRHATPKWTGDLATYRQMLVNHEVGHLLGMRHPDVQCPRRGTPAPIMAQQSTELNGCLPNPWPLPHEIERAARHDQPLAPGFGE